MTLLSAAIVSQWSLLIIGEDLEKQGKTKLNPRPATSTTQLSLWAVFKLT